MSLNILYLENRGSSSVYLIEALQNEGYEVFDCFDIHCADSYIASDRIDIYVLDLNLSDEGLSDEEKPKTVNGYLSGWIWFTHHVLPKDSDAKKRLIILSEYVGQLLNNIPKDELSDIYKIIPKRNSLPTELVLNSIKSLEKKLRR